MSSRPSCTPWPRAGRHGRDRTGSSARTCSRHCGACSSSGRYAARRRKSPACSRLQLRGADGAERLRKRARRAPEPSRCLFDRFGPGRLALAQPQILVGHLVPFVSAPDQPYRLHVGSMLSGGLQRSRCSCGYRLNQTEIEGDGHPMPAAIGRSRPRPRNVLRSDLRVARTHNQLLPMLPYPGGRGQIISMPG